MPRHRCRQSRAFFDILPHLQQNLLKILVVLLLARISRHWTSGKPASIITENWRVKIDKILGLDFLAAANLRDSYFAALFLDGSEGYLLAAKNLTQGIAVIGNAFADYNFV